MLHFCCGRERWWVVRGRDISRAGRGGVRSLSNLAAAGFSRRVLCGWSVVVVLVMRDTNTAKLGFMSVPK